MTSHDDPLLTPALPGTWHLEQHSMADDAAARPGRAHLRPAGAGSD